MLGPDSSVGAAAAIGATQTPISRPQPQQRVVEGSAKPRLPQHDVGSMYAKPPSTLARLSSAARQFADVLDTTGSVQVASTVSRFPVGHLDVYA